MSYLTIASTGETYEFVVKTSLLNIIQEKGIGMESPCGGRGTCGKCKIKILKGEINQLTQEETSHLTKEEIKQGIRLACHVKPQGDLTVELLGDKNTKHEILTEGYMPSISINPMIHKEVYKLIKQNFKNDLSYEEIIEDVVQQKIESNNIDLLKLLPEAFKQGEFTCVYLGGHIIGIEPGNTVKETYGIAMDIGTTTVVASLVDLIMGEEIASVSEINPQTEYGLDVLSRIAFVQSNPKGLELLHKGIINCINGLTLKLCNENSIAASSIYEITIAANTTMMHLLLGVNTDSIGKAPYTPVFKKAQNISAGSLCINISPFGRVYCVPSVSSFIGGDITAGIIVSKLQKADENILFIDIGTNGEIVISKAGKLSSCSCAAGPALEGMNISCGMRAAEGAIEGIKIHENKISLKVIGDKTPVGICGSGILESISEIARVGLIEKTGRIKKKESVMESNPGLEDLIIEENGKRKIHIAMGAKEIYITQKDIRQVQLAKGAISSGFYALLNLMEIDMVDLQEVIIAGQFGKHLNVDSLIGIGIIPEALRDKITYVGNSSKSGAVMCLLSQQVRADIETIAKDVNYFELSTMDGYEKLFTKCLSFS
ncbi:ASKHA domain-containing protein [Clostridium tagluense]|uniref:ASKHA domain-containing protein n=1 Tax=Clostridium tagluense TaxID=360422 RepID=UPI001C0CA3F1|nr:ASKHA domain-containing protein [Clostridium tagluense]MBU3126819.1 DUF4445 domain-containing protein [Clostridium tagluense]MCB2310495.1 ASKHA domain-containing protein [Clostridium tagluense]MCB2315339.1 ASKHA domain-containing protein [Clostridium tagluense]MCB2320190.1 ASKHA domain-containing protein [Clostridium tagluense]MCB2325081.1 ASKHA domain-containing protein [Clostridium tagluense]